MTRDDVRPYPQLDLSGGLQLGTSHLLKKRNEVSGAVNGDFNKKIGSVIRRTGYEKVARTIQQGNDSLYGGVYKYGTNFKILAGINNANNTNATLQVLDTADYWTTIISNAQANTRFQCTNFQDEFYIAGCSDNNVYLTLQNIDYTLTSSTSRNVYAAPKAKFITDFQGGMYAMNVEVSGKKYKNRIYPSSPAIGPITFVQTDQKGLLKQLRVDATTYLKVGMSVDIYGAGTEAKKQSAISIISIDKKNKRFSFADTTVDVLDNDEIWLSGTKNKLSIFWNTDDPTPQGATYYDLSPGREADPEITGHGKNNNRLLIFTKNSFYKHDGANMILVSDTVGCVSHETIQNIGPWTIWLHTSGVWGYNDNSSAEPKLLSRGIQPYINAINQTNLSKTSAGVVGRVYKLALGELLPLDSVTTSTSTSSTSTSSTSSSTSSTSTSSTSTSSTSTSSTTFTTSTSSTSASTSSTSSSTTSVSTSSTSMSSSTSTSSTTTTTAASSKTVVRLCYDFDMNAWWSEKHKREIRFQFTHTMNGYTKPYFTDDTGRLFRDETANLDNADTIPMEIELGRNNFGTDQRKRLVSVLVDSEKANGASLQVSLDGGNFQTVGTINNSVQKLVFTYPQGGQLMEARDINYKLVHNDPGESPIINGITTYYTLAETSVTEG